MPEWGDRAPWSWLWLCMAAKDRHYDGNRRFTVFLSERTAGRIFTRLKQKGLCGWGLQLVPAKLSAQQKLARLTTRPIRSAVNGVLIEN